MSQTGDSDPESVDYDVDEPEPEEVEIEESSSSAVRDLLSQESGPSGADHIDRPTIKVRLVGDGVTFDLSDVQTPPLPAVENPDYEKKAKLAYDEAVALTTSQLATMHAFRTRAQFFLTIATGAAALLSFSDEVQTGAAGSARFFSFWGGVAGFGVTAIAVMLLYLPVRWRENPGGTPKRTNEKPPSKQFFTGRPNNYDQGFEHLSPSRTKFIDQDDRSYARMLRDWNEFHRVNIRANEIRVAWMGRVTVAAIFGVALLVVAWIYNGYGLGDPPSIPPRMQVEIVDAEG